MRFVLWIGQWIRHITHWISKICHLWARPKIVQTHVNNVRLAQPITSPVRWRTEVFKIQGFVCKRLPSPPPLASFRLSHHFTRGQNAKSRSSNFLCFSTPRKRLLRRLIRRSRHLVICIEQVTNKTSPTIANIDCWKHASFGSLQFKRLLQYFCSISES